MRGIGLSRGGFWGFLALSFAVGLIIGVGLLVWQRTAFMAQVSSLEKRLDSRSAQAKDVNEQLEEVRDRLSAAESSMEALAAQNASLTTQLASSTAALEAARKAASTATTATATGPVAITAMSHEGDPPKAGQGFNITVTVRGSASRVVVRLFDVQQNITFKRDYTLTRIASSGGVETWRAAVSVPAAGHYHYWAFAFQGTKEVTRNTAGQLSAN